MKYLFCDIQSSFHLNNGCDDMISPITIFFNLAISVNFQPLSIATQVAGNGAPNCVNYDLGGQEKSCLPTFYFSSNKSMNAKSIGSDIIFNMGAVNKLTREEFALLSGHEIAHYYLGHTKSSKRAELEADRLGAELACNAGFDPQQGISVFRFAYRSSSHPSVTERIEAVRSVRCTPSLHGGHQLSETPK